MKPITVYQTADGRRHDSEADARTHERATAHLRLVGLTIEQVTAAMNREDTDLADAIEECGRRIGVARRDSGELRRRRKSEMAAGTLREPGTDPTDPETREGLKNAPPADPETRGAAAFIAGEGGVVPDDLKGDPEAAEAWLRGWDSASLANREKNDAAKAASLEAPAEEREDA